MTRADMIKPIVWSSGGGVQSTAIAALICTGRLPVPDLAIIADTGREKQSTWHYMESVVLPALEQSVGLQIVRVNHSYSTVDLYSANGENLLIPAFTSTSTTLGKLSNFCSYEWKRRACQRYVREQMPSTDVDVWLGFSTDEIGRCKASHENWWSHRFPLIENVRMSRADCMACVRDMGWPSPPRSSCWMCPLMSDQEWTEIADHEKELAAELEERIRRDDKHVWLHRSCEPIATKPYERQGDMFDSGCNTGYCFT